MLLPDQEPTLVVPALERADAEAAPGAPTLTIADWTDGTDPYAVATALLPPGGSYGISDSAWSMHLLGLQDDLPGTRYRALSACLPMLRAVKDTAELARLEAAGAAADAAYGEIVGMPFAGRREAEVAAELADLPRRFGHEKVDFTVVGSGPNGANPHHEAGDRVIEPGDAVVLDFGGLKHGYGSDTTRTVTVGEPSAQVREVHAIVREAQQAAFKAVRVGVPCQEIDRVARRVISEAGYGEQFIHRTGHGIGVTTHEPPYLVEERGSRSCRGCASPSNRASTSPGASASGSRTSSRSPTTAAPAGSTTPATTCVPSGSPPPPIPVPRRVTGAEALG